jgi:hypothetical protein
MSWLWSKIDAFLAAAAIAAMGVAGAQGQAFMVQYMQRLAGQLDQARAHFADVQTGLRYRVMGDAVRAELEAAARARVTSLERAYGAVKAANVLTRPVAMLRNLESDALAGTERSFVPALPLSAEAVAYTLAGMICGFALYEIVKLPVVAIARGPRRRKFRKR